MNIKTSLSTLGFCLLFISKIFGGIGIEDLHGITPEGTFTVSYNSCTPMPLSVTQQLEYVCDWNSAGACPNSTVVYKISIKPNQKGLKSYEVYVREGMRITRPLGVPIVLNIANNQGTIDNYFDIKFTTSGFKVNFCNSLNFSKYNITVSRCCRIITITPLPPNGNKVSAYPNPTNGVFNIEYGLTQQSNASILVFDRYNRLVKQVVKDEKQEIGEQNIQFDTYDLNDGIYYIRIQTGNEVVTKTMVVNKYSNY